MDCLEAVERRDLDGLQIYIPKYNQLLCIYMLLCLTSWSIILHFYLCSSHNSFKNIPKATNKWESDEPDPKLTKRHYKHSNLTDSTTGRGTSSNGWRINSKQPPSSSRCNPAANRPEIKYHRHINSITAFISSLRLGLCGGWFLGERNRWKEEKKMVKINVKMLK